jgi:DNA-binding MarR family transcriptional regulator
MSDSRKSDDRSLPVLNEDSRNWATRTCVALLQFQGRFERRMATTLGVHGLTPAQFDVLATLWHLEGITQQELAGRLLVTKGNVVGLIDRMSASEWVERRPDPEDRRVNRLYLTEAGRTILAKAGPSQFALVNQVFDKLNEAELAQMHAMLERLDVTCPESD